MTLVVAFAIYWIAAKLALSMAIPPGYATAVWPAAGLGLVCVLSWGAPAAAGIALASIAVNLATAFDGTSLAAIARSFAIAGAIGVAAAAQASIGAALIRRRIGFPTSLNDERDIVWFIVLGGPLACLTCSTISITVLSLAGVVAWSGFAFNWWTWWVGDTIGVLVFAPLALLVAPGQHPVWRRRRSMLGIPLVLGFAGVTALFLRVSTWEQARLHTAFESRATAVEAMLRSQLSRYEEVVASLASFFSASVNVTRDEFHTFCARALDRYPGIAALSWDPRVPAAQRTMFESRARSDGFADFSFTEEVNGELRVAGDRPEYVPVFYIEPQHKNARVLGYDVASDRERRETFERAARERRMAVTSRITLVQGGDEDLVEGILLVAPVFKDGSTAGYSVAAFGLRELVETVLHGAEHEGMSIILRERSPLGPSVALYASDAPPAPRAMIENKRIDFGDRRWQLEIVPTAAFQSTQRSWQAWTVLAAGLLFVGLLGIVLLIMTGRTFRLHEGAERFRALVEASAQIVWTTNAAGEIVEDSPSWRAFTGQMLEQWQAGEHLAAIHPDDRALCRERLPDAAAPPAVTEGEYRIRHRSGDWRWMAGRAVPLADSHGQLRGWVMSSTDITDRKRTAEQVRLAQLEREQFFEKIDKLNAELEQRVEDRTSKLSAALREREVLLQEVHHRVKNNLQVISSLINMQVRKLAKDADRAALEECQTRVHAIALIHEQLYQSHDYANVPFSDYTRSLVNNVLSTMGTAPGRIALDLAIANVAVPVDKAIPCGLILNELVTNAVKHAFRDRPDGKLRVQLSRDDQRIRLIIQDNGVGLPPDLDLRGAKTLGLRLVNTLVGQLRGTFDMHNRDGACFELSFSLENEH